MTRVTMLNGLTWRQKFTTQMGCLKGCLDYLHLPISFPWLYGGTGQAFALHVDPELNSAGLACRDPRLMFDLAPNLGFQVRLVTSLETAPDLPLDPHAWDAVRATLDRGLPCIGLEVTPPDESTDRGVANSNSGYFILTGYAPRGYYYASWDSGGPVPWSARFHNAALLHIYTVSLYRPAYDEEIVRAALTAARSWADLPHAFSGASQAISGLLAYETWAAALESGAASCAGHMDHLAAWCECREMAVDFLCAIHERLPGRCDLALYHAAASYLRVRKLLRQAIDLVPSTFDPFDHATRWRSPRSAELLREAGAAERQALEALGDVLEELARTSFRLAQRDPQGHNRPGGVIGLN